MKDTDSNDQIEKRSAEIVELTQQIQPGWLQGFYSERKLTLSITLFLWRIAAFYKVHYHNSQGLAFYCFGQEFFGFNLKKTETITKFQGCNRILPPPKIGLQFSLISPNHKNSTIIISGNSDILPSVYFSVSRCYQKELRSCLS